MKLFKFFALTVLLLVAGLSYGQKTGSAAFATTVISSSATQTIEFFDSTAAYNSPNFKKTLIATKPVILEHNGYKGLITIRDKNSGEVIWKGNVSRLKFSGLATGPGALRDSLTIVRLRTHLFSAYALLPLLFFRFGRRRREVDPDKWRQTS
ncbi:hypothetical protein [Larkinella harenae]